MGLLLAALALLVGCENSASSEARAKSAYSESFVTLNLERQELDRLEMEQSDCQAARKNFLAKMAAMSVMETLSSDPDDVRKKSERWANIIGDLARKIAEQKERVAKAEAAKNAAESK